MDRSMLSRATDGTDAPTPGYLYLDIAKKAASSPIACSEIATYLTRRLSTKNNHNIKFKCLKVIAKVAESPVTRGQFKRAVSQDPTAVSAIKEALQFRGPPDPARGDEIYARVRTAAKEALDAIYSDTPTSNEYGGGGGSMSSSYAPSPYAGGGGGHPPSSGGSRMQGIGNPMYPDPRLEAAQNNLGNMSIGEVVSVAGETIVGMIKDPLARNVDEPLPQRHGSSMPGYGSGGAYSGPPPGRSQLAQATGGQWTMASNRGPQAVAPPQNFNSERDAAYFKARDSGSNAFQWAQQNSAAGHTGQVRGGVGGSWGNASTGASATTPSVTISSQPRQPGYGAPTSHAPPTGSGGTAAADGSYERNLIMELCPPGGMKAEPPPDKLASFANAVPSLNPDLVCPVVLDCLEEGQPWIIRAKALCVIDTILKVSDESPQEGDTNPYSDFFYACREEIEPLASHPRAAIKEPARRVLVQLGIETPGGGAPPKKGFRPPRQSAAPPAAAAPNLLDFDEPAAPAPSAPPPPPAAPPPAEPPADSLFGGLKTKDAPAAAPPQPPPTPPAAEGLGDLLGGAASTPAPAPSGGGLFGDMQVKGSPPKAPDAADAAPPASGSAFGFLNSDAARKEPAAQAPPTKESFDPLLNMGNVSPATAKATMSNLTPAQMQAMAYQQMMMQQQQMQMAYAMQQQQMGRPMMMTPGMMMPQQGGSHRTVMQSSSGAASPFSFLDAPAPKKEDKKFDFVKDAMKDERK